MNLIEKKNVFKVFLFCIQVGLDVLHEFLSQIGEIRYIRAAYTDENAETRDAYVEFSEQPSIPKVLSINGFQFFGRPLL